MFKTFVGLWREDRNILQKAYYILIEWFGLQSHLFIIHNHLIFKM